MPLPPSFPIQLVSCRTLAPTVRELVFERDEGEMSFVPGQWVNLVLPTEGANSLLRAYSIASPPDASSRFELAVTRVAEGPGSALLHELRPGARLHALGPQGFFTRPADDGRPSLFVGTGTGVTPLRSMLRAAAGAGAGEPLWLLFGVRHESDILYHDELRALCEARPNVRVFVTLSRPSLTWQGRRGYVQAHLAELWEDLALQTPGVAPQLYVCGLERMVGAVRQIARKELGLARQQVHSERYD